MKKTSTLNVCLIAAKSRYYGLLLFMLLVIMVSCTKNKPAVTPPPPPPVVTVIGKFDVRDDKIFDSAGIQFVPQGVNVNGPKWPWDRPTIPDAGLIADVWKCNIVRVNCWPEFVVNNLNNLDLDGIVNAFTAKKVVVMLEDHHFTGRYPTPAELTTATNWWVTQANKYKNNAYVWFNLMNEPGENGVPVPAQWLNVHRAIIQAIRNTGANNIIVCDEHGFGQANGFDNNASSATLTYGETLTSQFKNIVFSLHLYGNWIYGKERLDSYVDAAKAKKLVVMMGEYGVGNDYSMEVTSSIMKVCIPKKIGRIAWHWAGVDLHKLVSTGSGGGFNIDNTSGAKPTNLSFAGNLVWMDNHQQLQVTDPALIPPPVIFLNADFEFGNPSSGSANIEGWINFGTAVLDQTPANVKQGSYSAKIPAGAPGGCGLNIYLQPGATYKVTAWGKNSIAVGMASNLGIKCTPVGGSEISLATLDFTSADFAEKTATFTVPAAVKSMFLFVYKNNATANFWCDDIRIVKL